MRSILCHPDLSPVLAYDFLSRCKFSTLASTPLYSSINRLFAQNPVLNCSLGEREGLSKHMYNGNIEQNPLCVKSCVTISLSSRFSPTFFHRDAISLLLRACLCTSVDSMRRKPCVRKCSSREREGLYNGQGQRAQFNLSAEL